ncbi:MAG: hypothetical protein ACWA6Y_04630 [Polaromonas sp.]
MIWGAICSIASSCVSAVGSAIASSVSTIGQALSSFSTVVAPIIATVIDTLKPITQAIGQFANAFLQALGILKPDETVQDLGERALQAVEKGITMEKFDNFEGYMDALRKFELGPEVSAKRNPTEKIVAGLGAGTIGVENKFNAERGSLNAMWLLPMANPSYFTPERMQDLVSTGRLSGDILGYLEKKLDGADASSLRKGLEITPDGKPMNDTELGKVHEALGTAQDVWADLAKQMEEKNNPLHGA